MDFSSTLKNWALFLLIGGVVLLSIEIGWRFGYRRHQLTGEVEDNSPVKGAVGATLGLLALLLAFTFSMAATRFDNRRELVFQEANAIGTVYLRAEFLPEGTVDEARRLLREYAALRVGGQASILDSQNMAKVESIHDRLWMIAAEEASDSDSIRTWLLVDSLNQVFDLDAVRVATFRNRIPETIWLMVAVVAIVSMAALGYDFGLTGARNWAIALLMIIVLSTVVMLIVDLDWPQSGLIEVSQQPMIDLIYKIGADLP